MLAARLNDVLGSNSTLANPEVGMELALNVNETSGEPPGKPPESASSVAVSWKPLLVPVSKSPMLTKIRSSEVAVGPVLNSCAGFEAELTD